MNTNEPIVLFDGHCNLCNRSVDFIIRHDKAERYRFAALQSESAQRLLTDRGITAEGLNTVILVTPHGVFRRSSAGLRIARHLDGLWPVLWVFILVPKPVRDAVYDWIARNRIRWFGERETCRVPTPSEAARFL
jgi:predicted DCC family thiol-disulfide oxidoreductase YuxK